MEKKKSKKARQKIAAELGRQGGLAIVRKRGKAYMSKLARKGGKARWANSPKQP